MSNANEFDEIARRKLQEREFAFDESQWNAVKGSLPMADEPSRRFLWLFSIAGLLFIGAVTWWALLRTAPTTTAEYAPRVNAIAQPGSALGTEHVNAPDTPKGTKEDITAPTIAKAAMAPVQKPSEHQQTIDLRDLSRATASGHRQAHAPTIIDRAHVDLTIAASNSTQPQVHPEGNAPKPDAHSTPADTPHSSSEPATPSITGTAQPNTQANMAALTSHPNNTLPPAIPDPGTPAVASATPPDPNASTITTDTAIAPVSASNDTSAAEPAPPQIFTPPLRASHLELSLLAGSLHTLGSYSGVASANWNADVQGTSSLGVGLEMMSMHEHFGIGAGLQYTTYAEHIRADEINANEDRYSTSYYLMSVHALLLSVIDTIYVNGIAHYVTGQLDTNINVLISQNDTSTAVVRKREARDVFNTVSYLEVPLLLDAHTGIGRWTFGVRGGPTLGLLNSRRGSLPNGRSDGFVDLQAEEFRSIVLGYTARVYLRYRFGDSWSVGLEPTIRGQLMNSLDVGDLSRRSSAIGAMLSLSYRLP